MRIRTRHTGLLALLIAATFSACRTGLESSRTSSADAAADAGAARREVATAGPDSVPFLGSRLLPADTAPAPPRPELAAAVGEYVAGSDTLVLREKAGRPELLRIAADSVWTLPAPSATGWTLDAVAATPDGSGRPEAIRYGGREYHRIALGPEDGSSFRIVPLRPVEELRREAMRATPPVETGKRAPELVEVVKLDPGIRLDIRYATANNFMAAPFYSAPRAFLQRPAAEALVRAHRRLARYGYGILIHDAYRPWYVTWMFWEATPDAQKQFVADPAHGSRHNRGVAADISLYELATGRAAEMTSGYDEFSNRALPGFPGGTSRQRWLRALLRSAMEAEGFTVYPYEWWHFDHENPAQWPILNVPFEAIGK